MSNIDLSGARVTYADAGSGEAVLLLHSSASSGAQWRSLMEMLQASCRLLAPDLYGYGETDPWLSDVPLRLTDEAMLADAVLAECDRPIHLIGHSYGGAIGLRFAVEQPERLLSLTLIEPVAFHLLRGAPVGAADHDLYGEIAGIATAITNAVRRGDDRGGMATFIDYWNGAGAWMQMNPELQNALARRTAKVALDFEATMNEPTPIAALGRIAVPVLVLRGSASPRPTRRIAELIAEVLPQAQLRTIEGAGHMLPLTHREAVNAVIAEHLFHSMADRQRFGGRVIRIT
jgi:pimeloyl-ACP methyl ester carboxylesterase